MLHVSFTRIRCCCRNVLARIFGPGLPFSEVFGTGRLASFFAGLQLSHFGDPSIRKIPKASRFLLISLVRKRRRSNSPYFCVIAFTNHYLFISFVAQLESFVGMLLLIYYAQRAQLATDPRARRTMWSEEKARKTPPIHDPNFTQKRPVHPNISIADNNI